MAPINSLASFVLLAAISTCMALATAESRKLAEGDTQFTVEASGESFSFDFKGNGDNVIAVGEITISIDVEGSVTTEVGSETYFVDDVSEGASRRTQEVGLTGRRLQSITEECENECALDAAQTCGILIAMCAFDLFPPLVESTVCPALDSLCDQGGILASCEATCVVTPAPTTGPTPAPSVCPNQDVECDDPHMQGLRGQRIDWSGVDGGWYSLIKDENADLDVNLRVTAPLPDEFPDRQLITSLAVLSQGHSVVVEVENPYTIDTNGCPEGVSPCLANGGLRIHVDGQEVNELLRFSRQVPVAGDAISVSASNLPVECRQFGGDRIWARQYEEMLQAMPKRRLRSDDESLEDWILRFGDGVAAPDWCAKYIAENDLADLQSNHAIFKIETSTVTIRLNAGINYQGGGELNWDGRVLPNLEFWQMDIGMQGLDVENPALSGLLGETAHPVYDENGKAVMEGLGALRGTVKDYRVSGALGVHFPLLDK